MVNFSAPQKLKNYLRKLKIQKTCFTSIENRTAYEVTFDEEIQKNTNIVHISPKFSKKNNSNMNHIAVGDTVLFVGWVGLEAGVYVTFTG